MGTPRGCTQTSTRTAVSSLPTPTITVAPHHRPAHCTFFYRTGWEPNVYKPPTMEQPKLLGPIFLSETDAPTATEGGIGTALHRQRKRRRIRTRLFRSKVLRLEYGPLHEPRLGCEAGGRTVLQSQRSADA